MEPVLPVALLCWGWNPGPCGCWQTSCQGMHPGHVDNHLSEHMHGKVGVTASEPLGDLLSKAVPAAGSSQASIFPHLKIHDPFKTIKIPCPLCFVIQNTLGFFSKYEIII